MSASGINFIYNILGVRKNAFKIYYDFSEKIGGQIPSVSGGNSSFPADIVGNLNVVNSSGLFDTSIYLQPQNVDNTFDSNNWSMLFNYEKKNSEECLLYNSLETGYVSSGFQIGINDANKVYFHFYGSGAPFYYTSDNIIGSKNVINVSKTVNNIEFSYYNFNTKNFETETYPTEDKFLFPSYNINLFQNFSGEVDDFIYLDGNVSYSNRQRLCSGFFLDASFVTGRIGVTGYESYKTGHIDGNNKVYETGLKILTGNLNYSNQAIKIENFSNLKYFGTTTDNCDISESLYIYNGIYTGRVSLNSLFPLTGFLISESHISGGFVEPIEISGIQVTGYSEYYYPVYTGVTGVVQESYVDYIDDCGRPVFAYSDLLLTGVLSGESLAPLTGWVSSNLGSGLDFWKSGSFIIQDLDSSSPFFSNSNTIFSYGMEYVTYINEEDIGDLQEIIILPERQNLNLINRTPFYDTLNREFFLDRLYPTGGINLFLNGLLQYQSGYIISGDAFNVIYAPQADYFISGARVKSNLFFTTGDLIIYDGGVSTSKKIAPFAYSTSFTTSGLFTDFRIFEDDLVFLNGQKMYSGLNYRISGSEWLEPISGFDITGTLITVKKLIGERSLTGEYNKFTKTKFPRKTSIYFLNGVRIPRDQYIEHSSIDLISGDNISLKGMSDLYNNDGLLGFWE